MSSLEPKLNLSPQQLEEDPAHQWNPEKTHLETATKSQVASERRGEEMWRF